MKSKALITIFMIIICLNPLHADNRVMILTDTIYIANSEPEIVVGFENDSLLQGTSNGFRISTTGDIAAWFDTLGAYPDPDSRGGTVPGALWWHFRYTPPNASTPDTVLTVGWEVAPLPGLYPGEMEPIFHIPISIEGSMGTICIDSCALVAPGGTWLWDDGHGNVNPSFNDGQGPHCIEYTYLCGDANRDGLVNVSDVVRIKNWIFLGGGAPDPIESGDVNCDGSVNVSDAVWIINWVFKGGNWPCDTDGDGVPDC